MSETETKAQGQKPKTSMLAITSIIFGGIPPFAPIGLVLGILAIIRIKKSKGQLTGQAAAILGIVAATSFIVIMIIAIITISIYDFGFPRPRPFSKCDPNKVISLIKNNFEDFNLPNNIKSAKAVETRTSWLEHTYNFILNFTTDEKGWEQFHTSFPKVEEHDTVYIDTDGREYIHDMYNFMDYGLNDDDPRSDYKAFWGGVPKWHKTKITKGKYYYYRRIYSKDRRLQIDTLVVDLADPENVVIYIEGWGPYDPSYGLD